MQRGALTACYKSIANSTDNLFGSLFIRYHQPPTSIVIRLITSVALACLFLASHLSADPHTGRITPDALRAFVSHFVMPNYPAEAVANHQTGAVVADVYLTPEWKVDKVSILESPSPVFNHAVEDAIREWRFQSPPPNFPHLELVGKAIFYFRFVDGHFIVTAPSTRPLPKREPE